MNDKLKLDNYERPRLQMPDEELRSNFTVRRKEQAFYLEKIRVFKAGYRPEYTSLE